MYTSFGGTNLSTLIGLSECSENQTRKCHGSGDSEPWETQLEVQDLRDAEIDSGAQWLGNVSYNKDVDLSCEDSAKVLGQ